MSRTITSTTSLPESERARAADIFAKRWRENGDCWEWTGTINTTTGYGELSVGSRGNTVRWRAHRLSYLLHNGALVDDLFVLHKCDNKWCVNPDHLELGTNQKNIKDAYDRGLAKHFRWTQTHCKNGHAFTPENTIDRPHNMRGCRLCQELKSAKARRIYEAGYKAGLSAVDPQPAAKASTKSCGCKRSAGTSDGACAGCGAGHK